jgi:aromatic ring-opening dioxygenase LigB subunit
MEEFILIYEDKTGEEIKEYLNNRELVYEIMRLIHTGLKIIDIIPVIRDGD